MKKYYYFFLSVIGLFIPSICWAAGSELSEKQATLILAPFMILWVLWMLLIFLFWLGIMVFAIGGGILWIFMLIDVMKRDFVRSDDKTLWILVLVFAGVIGAIIYYYYGRQQGVVRYQPTQPFVNEKK